MRLILFTAATTERKHSIMRLIYRYHKKLSVWMRLLINKMVLRWPQVSACNFINRLLSLHKTMLRTESRNICSKSDLFNPSAGFKWMGCIMMKIFLFSAEPSSIANAKGKIYHLFTDDLISKPIACVTENRLRKLNDVQHGWISLPAILHVPVWPQHIAPASQETQCSIGTANA